MTSSRRTGKWKIGDIFYAEGAAALDVLDYLDDVFGVPQTLYFELSKDNWRIDKCDEPEFVKPGLQIKL